MAFAEVLKSNLVQVFTFIRGSPGGIKTKVIAFHFNISVGAAETYVRKLIELEYCCVNERNEICVGKAECGSVSMFCTILFEGPKKEDELARRMGMTVCMLHEFTDRVGRGVYLRNGLVRDKIRPIHIFSAIRRNISSRDALAAYFDCEPALIDYFLQALCMDMRIRYVDDEGMDWTVECPRDGRLPSRLVCLEDAISSLSFSQTAS